MTRGLHLPRRYQRPLGYSVAVAASLYLLAVALADGRAVWAQVMGLPLWLVAVGLLLPSTGFLVRYLRWDLFLRRLGDHVPWQDHLRVYLAGFALTTTPGKVGENIRAVYLANRGVPAAHSLAAFVAERLGDVIAMLLLSTLAVRLLSGYGWVMGVIAAATCGVIVLVRHPSLPHRLRGLAGKPMVGALASGAGRAVDAARDLLSGRLIVSGAGIALLAWGAESATFALLVTGMGVQVPILGAMGIFAVATLVGALSFLPGGIGPTEAILAGALVLAGADTPTAAAATLLIRVFTLWWAVLAGIVCLMSLRPAAGVPGLPPTDEDAA